MVAATCMTHQIRPDRAGVGAGGAGGAGGVTDVPVNVPVIPQCIFI